VAPGLSRRPRLGQYFLRNPSFLGRIAEHVRAAAPESGWVVEIGPGRGALTDRLLAAGLRLLAVEVDTSLAGLLRTRHRNEPRLEVIEADILQVDLARLIEDRTSQPAVVAGNLPYYITSPILRRIFAASGHISEAVLLVQKEVAQRIAARPGTRDYGFLSVLCQTHSRPELLCTVPPGAFQPPPKVTSALIRLRLEQRFRDWGISDPEAFLQFAQTCFHQKRKTLLNNLQGAFGRDRVGAMAESRLRAEQLSPERLAKLWLRLAQRDGTS
jgi:16S rRNA (adenine1518-N6/adenine1519-N6)-dimethyltransferase